MAQVTLGRHTSAKRNPWTGTISTDARTVCVQTLHELQGSGEDFELLLNILTEDDVRLETTRIIDPVTGKDLGSKFDDPETKLYDKGLYAKWQQRQLSGMRSRLNKYAEKFGYEVANSTPYVAHEEDGHKVGLELVTIVFEPAKAKKATVATKSPAEVVDEFIKSVLVGNEEEETA